MRKNGYIIGGVLLAIILLIAIFIVFCPGPREVHLTAADNGREIELKKGDILGITLKANPTTGYTWEVAESPDEQVMQQVDGIEFKPVSEQASELGGAGGVQIIQFKIVNAGRTALKLVYHRPSEKDVEPAETFYIQIVAR